MFLWPLRDKPSRMVAGLCRDTELTSCVPVSRGCRLAVPASRFHTGRHPWVRKSAAGSSSALCREPPGWGAPGFPHTRAPPHPQLHNPPGAELLQEEGYCAPSVLPTLLPAAWGVSDQTPRLVRKRSPHQRGLLGSLLPGPTTCRHEAAFGSAPETHDCCLIPPSILMGPLKPLSPTPYCSQVSRVTPQS